MAQVGAKRALDLVLSAALLDLSAPIVALLALLVKGTSPGADLYQLFPVSRVTARCVASNAVSGQERIEIDRYYLEHTLPAALRWDAAAPARRRG